MKRPGWGGGYPRILGLGWDIAGPSLSHSPPLNFKNIPSLAAFSPFKITKLFSIGLLTRYLFFMEFIHKRIKQDCSYDAPYKWEPGKPSHPRKKERQTLCGIFSDCESIQWKLVTCPACFAARVETIRRSSSPDDQWTNTIKFLLAEIYKRDEVPVMKLKLSDYVSHLGAVLAQEITPEQFNDELNSVLQGLTLPKQTKRRTMSSYLTQDAGDIDSANSKATFHRRLLD